jgi:hypothetical protein
MKTYLAVPALPSEQQDRDANPSGGPLGWMVVRASDEEVVAGHTMYLNHAEAESIAARMSAGVPVKH